MAQNIGGSSFDIVDGIKRGPSESLATWKVAGLDGIGAMKLGESDSSFQFRGIKWDTNANIETLKAVVEAFQGTIISVEDSFGNSYSNLLVKRAELVEKKAVIYGGSSRVRAVFVVAGSATG